MFKPIKALEQRLSPKPLKWITGILLALLCVGVPVYAGVSNITMMPDSQASCSASSNSDAISTITSFYQNLFAGLAMLLGLVVALAYLTIRAVSREAAQETVQKEVERYFSRDKPFLDGIEESIDDAVEEQLVNMDLSQQIVSLEIRVAELEKRASGNADEEDKDDPGQLS